MHDAPEPPSPSTSSPWELGPTLGLSLLTVLLLFFVGTAVSICFVVVLSWQDPNLDTEALAKVLTSSGLLVSVSTLISGPLCIGLICALIKMRPTMTIKGYLDLYWPTGRSLLIWNLLLVAFLIVADRITEALNQTDDFIETAYQTAQIPVLLFLAVVIVAPVFEELLFRGFMFKGIEASRLGAGGAILITSGVWAVIHLQYNLYFMAVIFGLGLLLGAARVQTRSTYVPIAMHGLNNLIAFMLTAMS